MKKEGISDDVLVKYLLREATEAEQLEVQEWVLQSRENKDHLNQLRLLWTQSSALAPTGTVDTNEAWQRFAARTEQGQPVPSRRVPLRWMRAAAAILLLVGVGTAIWYYTGTPAKEQTMAQHKAPTVQSPAPVQKAAAPEVAAAPVQQPSVSPTQATAEHMQQRVVNTTYVSQPSKHKPAAAVAKAERRDDAAERLYKYYRSNEFVCNGTPCPLEICIIQTIKCPGCKPSAVATCSTLLPDQSGQLRYKEPNKIEENCKVSVQEIRIRRVTTGETIVLDEHSKPATAEELFSYITGRKKGNILAGIFHTDCENDEDEHDLKLENNFGNLILQ